MYSLRIKLFGAFAVVILVGVTTVIVLTRQGTATRFSHFMVGSQMVQPSRLLSLLEAFYRRQNDWTNLDAALENMLQGSSTDGMMRGMMGDMMGMLDSRVRVVDAQGQVVADSAGVPNGSLEPAELASGWPILVDGRPAGVLIIDGFMMTAPGLNAKNLLGGVTRAVSVAALIAAGVALLIGALLIRQITHPVAELSQVAHQIAAGDLAARATVSSRDEIGQLAQTFNRMADSLQHQEELRRQLLADIAHELRTPLAAIQGSVEALQDGVFPLTTDSLEPVYEQTMMLNRLIDDLRTLSLADAGELSLNLTAVDLVDLIHNCVATWQPQARADQIGLILETVPGEITIVGDGDRLGQVCHNLLSNALRHTPQGGTVIVQFTPTGDGAQLAVIDSGEGIPPTDLPYVFDRFYRADRSRNRATGGSGLGLAIARHLIDAHGGHISVESPPRGKDHGTAFYITIPANVTKSA